MIVRWPAGPAGTPPLLITGAGVVTVPTAALDDYRAAGIPIVTLEGDDTDRLRKHYENLDRLRTA